MAIWGVAKYVIDDKKNPKDWILNKIDKYTKIKIIQLPRDILLAYQ